MTAIIMCQARLFGRLGTGRLIGHWWNAMSPTPGSKILRKEANGNVVAEGS